MMYLELYIAPTSGCSQVESSRLIFGDGEPPRQTLAECLENIQECEKIVKESNRYITDENLDNKKLKNHINSR